MSLAYVPSLDRYGETETIALFPVTTGTGITGELAWWRMQRSELGLHRDEVEAVSEIQSRRDTLVQHDRYMAALRKADVEGLVGTLTDGAQSAVRDYVEDTGTLVSIDDKDGHRRYYQSVFDLFSIDGSTALPGRPVVVHVRRAPRLRRPPVAPTLAVPSRSTRPSS